MDNKKEFYIKIVALVRKSKTVNVKKVKPAVTIRSMIFAIVRYNNNRMIIFLYGRLFLKPTVSRKLKTAI